MNAIEFKVKLENIAPTIEELKKTGLSEEGAVEINREWILKKRVHRRDVDNPIFDLVFNYDTVDIGVGTITIDDSIEEIDRFVFFGNFEGDFLAVDKINGEIKVLDYETGNEIYECAENSFKFLDAMIPVSLLYASTYINNSITENVKRETAKEAAMKAGDMKFLPFFYRLVGCH